MKKTKKKELTKLDKIIKFNKFNIIIFNFKLKIISSIKSLTRSCKWFKRMWNNKDWDYTYMLEVWRYKLVDFQKFWGNSDNVFCEDKERLQNFNNITKCIIVLTRLIEDKYYLSNEYIICVKNWNSLVNKKKISKKKKEEEIKKVNAEYSKCFKMSEKQKEDDKLEFFTLLKDNYEFWWD